MAKAGKAGKGEEAAAVLKNIFARRSIREFSDEKIPKKTIELILNAGVQAPSAKNKQPWRFVVVEGKNKVKALADEIMNEFGALKYGLKALEKLRGKDVIFHGAPLLVLIVANKDAKWGREDCALAAENMFLVARTRGIGSCWIATGTYLNNMSGILRELGIPVDHEVVAPLVFGYPAKGFPPAADRKPKILKWIE